MKKIGFFFWSVFRYPGRIISHFRYTFTGHRVLSEIIYLIFHVVIFVLALLFQFGTSMATSFFNTRVDNIEALSVGVFQVQATIATLSIAVTSLLSSMFTTKYYGINLASYALEMRPLILKYKYLIIVNMLYIILNLAFVLFRLPVMVCAITISCIFHCIKMTLNVFSLISFNSYRKDYKLEVKAYILSGNIFSSRRGFSTDIAKQRFYLMRDEIKQSLLKDDQNIIDCIDILIETGHEYCRYMVDLNDRFQRNSAIDAFVCFFKDIVWLFQDILEKGNATSLFMLDILRCLSTYLKTARDQNIKLSFSRIIITLVTDHIMDCDLTIFYDKYDGFRRVRNLLLELIDNNSDFRDIIIDFLPTSYLKLASNSRYRTLSTNLKQKIWTDLVSCDSNERLGNDGNPQKCELLRLIPTMIHECDIDILRSILPLNIYRYHNRLNLTIRFYLFGEITKCKNLKLKSEYQKMAQDLVMEEYKMHKLGNELDDKINEVLDNFEIMDVYVHEKWSRGQTLRHMEINEFKLFVFYLLLELGLYDEEEANNYMDKLFLRDYQRQIAFDSLKIEEYESFVREFYIHKPYLIPDYVCDVEQKVDRAYKQYYAYYKKYQTRECVL